MLKLRCMDVYTLATRPGPHRKQEIAEAYGANAIRVTKLSEVESAMKNAMSVKDRPTLIDFVVEKEENVFPFVPPGQAINEMLID